MSLNCWASNSPRSEIRNSGITTSASKLSCILGLFNLQPQAAKTIENGGSLPCNDLWPGVGHYSGDGESYLPDYLSLTDNYLPSTNPGKMVGSNRQIFVVGADQDHVMAIMSNRRSNSAGSVEPKTVHQSNLHSAGAVMSLNHRSLGDILSYFRLYFSPVEGQLDPLDAEWVPGFR